MHRAARALFSIACTVGCAVAAWHFTVPYSSKWFSYIPAAPTEIIQSINYVNFCFSLLLAGVSLLLLVVQKELFDGSRGLRLFYTFYALVWLSRVVVQMIWPWPSSLQLWLVVAFSTETVIALIPAVHLFRNARKQE